MLTATAAGTLLGALWFVPSANATVDAPARAASAAPTTQVMTERQADAGRAGTGSQARYETTSSSSRDAIELADTGSIDTTPYVVGGTLFLAVGAGFVVYSVRRERLGF
jgi:LPXTG-motif cell wall-anchored protein